MAVTIWKNTNPGTGEHALASAYIGLSAVAAVYGGLGVGKLIAAAGTVLVGAGGAGATQLAAKFDWNRVDHIFREADGHVNAIDPADQERFANLFERVASSSKNLRSDFPLPAGAIRAGIQAFTQRLPSGEQVWVYVRNGIIQDAGINSPGAGR